MQLRCPNCNKVLGETTDFGMMRAKLSNGHQKRDIVYYVQHVRCCDRLMTVVGHKLEYTTDSTVVPQFR